LQPLRRQLTAGVGRRPTGAAVPLYVEPHSEFA
jgi:hypothetical protein